MLEVVTPAETRVRELAAEFAATWQRTVTLAIELGDALLILKRELGHGAWLPWVEANFYGSADSAERFIRLARNSADLRNLPPETPLTAAIAWLQSQRRGERGRRESRLELDGLVVLANIQV